MKSSKLIVLSAGFFLAFLIISSCATSRQAQQDTARRGYMLQDKSEYSRNKGKYKGGKSYDHLRKKNKRHLKKQRRR